MSKGRKREMVKKELTNKKVVRAIALGLSAVMLTTPMTAMASDNVTPQNDDEKSPVADEQKTDAEVADSVASDAKTFVSVTDNAVDTVVGTVVEKIGSNSEELQEKAEKTPDVLTDDEKIIIASAELDSTPSASDDIIGDGEGDADNDSVETEGVQEQLDVAMDAEGDAEEAVDGATTAVGAMNSTAAEAAGAMSDAQTDVDNKIAEINNATSSVAAEDAYIQLQDIVTKAEKDYAAAEETYSDAKQAYEDALGDLADAKQAYETAISAATSDAEQALADLKAAEAKAAALEAAAKTAEDNLADNSIALEIKRLQGEVAKDTSPNWSGDLDDLFAYVLEYYYLPTEVGASNIKMDKETSWNKDSSDDSRNFFTVTFTDASGEEVTKYYNYKLSNKADGLIIFEKVDEDLYTYQGADGKTVKLNKEAYDKLVAKKDSPVVTVTGGDNDATNDVTVVKIGAGDPDVKVSEENTDTKKVEITDKKITYSLDDKGNLVETVTGTVTTTTYQAGASLTAESKDTSEAALLAAQQKASALEAAGEEDVVIANEATVTTKGYVIEGGYYIPTFTEEIDISVTLGNAEADGNNWNDTTTPISDSEIQAAINREAQRKIDEFVRTHEGNREGDYYFFDDYAKVVDSNLGTNNVVADESRIYNIFNGEWVTLDSWDEYTRTATAKISITYAKVVEKEENYSMWDDAWDFDTNQYEELKEDIQDKLDSTGGIYLNMRAIDFKYRIATYSCVEGVKIADTVYKSEAAAQAALDSIKGEVTVEGQVKAKNSYAYKITYTNVTKGEPQQNTPISTTTYKASKVNILEDQHTSNANYNKYINSGKKDTSGILFFEESLDENGEMKMHKGLAAFINAAEQKLADYQEIQRQADVAEQAAVAAANKVQELKDALSKASMTDYSAELSALASQLAIAEKNWKDAVEDYEELQGKMDEMEKEIDSILDELRAAEEAANASDDSDSGDDDTTTVVTVPTPVVLEEAPIAPVVVTAPGVAAPAVVDIEDEDTPLAGGIGAGDGIGDAEGGEGEVIVAGAEEEAEPAIVAIEDEETPLAAGVDADAKVSWWWLLIIALLGATGYKMYKDHQKRKEEATQEA